ncbi:MAG: hypothetical protein ACI8Z7_000142 [Candidatus Nanohaloarchaea archaeon]|jgi:hypothetical protein
MNPGKFAVLTAVVLMLVSLASASSFGSFSSDTTKQIDSSETRFSISVFNLGNQTLQLSINSTQPEGASIVHEDEIELEPSEVTRNPSGDKQWFLTSNNRYVETTEIPVRFFRDADASRDNFEFTVDIQASSSINEGESGVVQNIVQVRSYSYQVETDVDNVNSPDDDQGDETDSSDPGQSPGNGGTDDLSPGDAIGGIGDAIGGIGEDQEEQDESNQNENNGEDETDQNQDSPADRNSDSPGDGENTNTNSGESDSLTGRFLQSASVNGTTIVMFLFMAGSVVYFVRVI